MTTRIPHTLDHDTFSSYESPKAFCRYETLLSKQKKHAPDSCAAAFVVLILIAASLGLAPDRLPKYKQSDKVLHFVTFFLITVRARLLSSSSVLY